MIPTKQPRMLTRAWRFLNGTLIGQVVGTLLVTLLLGAGTSIWQVRTGQPASLLHRVPVNVWWALGGFVAAAALAGLIGLAVRIRRVRRSRDDEKAHVVIDVVRHPHYGWREFDVDYAGMSWRLVVSLQPPYRASGAQGFNPSDAQVESRPRCPKCGTGLEEQRTLWGYRVRCVTGDFKVTQRDSFAVLASRATLVGQRQLELAEQQRRRQSAD